MKAKQQQHAQSTKRKEASRKEVRSKLLLEPRSLTHAAWEASLEIKACMCKTRHEHGDEHVPHREKGWTRGVRNPSGSAFSQKRVLPARRCLCPGEVSGRRVRCVQANAKKKRGQTGHLWAISGNKFFSPNKAQMCPVPPPFLRKIQGFPRFWVTFRATAHGQGHGRVPFLGALPSALRSGEFRVRARI